MLDTLDSDVKILSDKEKFEIDLLSDKNFCCACLSDKPDQGSSDIR